MKINNIIHTFLITLTLFLVPVFAYGSCGTFSSGDLLKTCEIGIKSAEKGWTNLSPDDAYNSGFCLGYIKGFIHMELAYSVTLAIKSKANATDADMRKNALFCLPPSMLNKKYVQIFVDYMHKHPEEANKDACSSVLNAFSQDYPCK
ncbi:hypothetical protein AQUSIP_06950 [Aquicella siphonis]|uniref:Rap1a immunity protein domain-containing protein n=1 Tax=Aquicella siphonis TaxID=254247 RepID=A0A5E4PFK8_9COXI|nr:Rap1a/Tai family immunity protein [Aquicella siphonis]VVC75405.1 hypothetical protein AQUSIP_06950 [Aquicella siphonis]